MGEFSIQISTSLVNKLVGDTEKSKKKTRRTKPKVSREPQQTQPKINQKKVSDDSEPLKGSGAKGWPLQPPLYMPVPPPSQSTNADLDAIRSVLQQSESVVERLKKQEENLAQEVTQRAKELRDKEFKLPYQKPMPCLVEKDACVDCYKEHGTKDPLKCANLVNSYADCARKVRQQKVFTFVDDPKLSCEAALKKMYSLLEKVEQSVYAILRTRDMAISRCKEFGISVDWLLDSRVVGKIKLSFVQLARKYMKRVASELDAMTAPQKEPNREFILLQGVRFAFRVHRFAGGFDAESMKAFEELRGRANAPREEDNAPEM